MTTDLAADLERRRPAFRGDLASDAGLLTAFVEAGDAALTGAREGARRARVRDEVRGARHAFLRRNAATLYEELTSGRREHPRTEALLQLAAEHVPGLVPDDRAMAEERRHKQSEKQGLEIDQGELIAQFLADRRSGLHLVHSMLRPKEESLVRLDEFRRTGSADLGAARVTRQGRLGTVEIWNPAVLNAEDDTTVPALEVGTDLVLLDPEIEVCMLRGSVAEHPKYRGRRVFNSGINLTNLYWGKISFADFFIPREMGWVNKIRRGIWHPDAWREDDWSEELEGTWEKPWIMPVETHAIGGGCQVLLVADRILAEAGSITTLPAKKEGIIPGTSNGRLPIFVGDRATRQAIMADRGFRFGDDDARDLCDEVVDRDGMEAAITRNVEQMVSAGPVSASANRKAIRILEEPVDDFRRYAALYCREQAKCAFAPALISNLERNWRAHERRH
ncbi:MAG: enoyl-CoA hydratase-related protein [Candidatus Dormibacteraceae bacterium]